MDVAQHRWECSRGDFVEGLVSDEAMRERLTSAIAGAPFEAVFWETPPVMPSTSGEPFEFVLVDSPALARVRAKRAAFDEHLRAAGQDALVTSFVNIGGDADLVAPTPAADDAGYAHLASFVRIAPPRQIDAMWIRVGEVMLRRLAASPEPIWLSTSGLGVFWVHIRIDSRPKYYMHAPYRIAPPARP